MKIYRISGNFTQHDFWSEPDPGFVGEIVVQEDGLFYGYQEEQYSCYPYSPVRYINGVLKQDGVTGAYDIAFLKFSNERNLAPLAYVVSDLYHEIGIWCGMEVGFEIGWDFGEPDGDPSAAYVYPRFRQQGNAKVTLEPIEYSPDKEEEILSKWKEIDLEFYWNKILVTTDPKTFDQLFDVLEMHQRAILCDSIRSLLYDSFPVCALEDLEDALLYVVETYDRDERKDLDTTLVTYFSDEDYVEVEEDKY